MSTDGAAFTAKGCSLRQWQCLGISESSESHSKNKIKKKQVRVRVNQFISFIVGSQVGLNRGTLEITLPQRQVVQDTAQPVLQAWMS